MKRALLLALAAVALGCDEKSPYPKKDNAFHPGRAASCGEINIRIAGANDAGGAAEGAIVFEFVPAANQEGCCRRYGWIQHTKRGGSTTWFYDNGAAGGGAGAPPVGSESDPKKQPQPVTRPEGDGPWKENPWYGAETSTTTLTAEQKDAFRRNPRPQLVIGDKPGGKGDCFRTQLVCADTGKVLFTWEWCDDPGFPGKISSPPPPA